MAARTRLLLVTAALTLIGVPAALALAPALEEKPVLTGPRNEWRPAVVRANGVDILLWSQTRPGRPDRTDVYLRKGGGSKMKLNTGKTRGYGGDIVPPLVVYGENTDTTSDLRFYRLDKRKRVPAPKGLNTKEWEWGPRMSGNWILFGRDRLNAPTTRIVLFNRKTRAQRILASGRYDNGKTVGPGQVSGNWATWYSCQPVCNSFVYNIATRAKIKLAKPAGPPVNIWTVGVTKNGVVYAGRGPEGCGNDVQLVRYRGPSDPAEGTVILDFPDGKDFNGIYARLKADGSVDVYYTRVSCGSTETTNIYKVTDPAPPSP